MFMKTIDIYIKIWFAALGLILSTTACSSDEKEYPDNGDMVQGNMKLVLNIHPLATRSITDQTVTEMIRSLRIIIIDSDSNEIEENKLVTLNGLEAKPVVNFQYFYTWITNTGNKRIILLANEESVSEIRYKPAEDVTLPAELPTDLSDLLDSYLPGEEADAETLYNILSSVYFTPDYEINDNSQIYLPYVATYEEEITKQVPDQNSDTWTQQPVEWTTYMVPVAAKFTFIFNNYREYPVNVNEITMRNGNLDNYLMAQVGGDDLYKVYDGTKYYWIDWLARVAQESADNTGSSENDAFNTANGWITDYEMPTDRSQEMIFMIAGDEEEFGFAVPGAQIFNGEDGITVPTTVTAGPFYLPESQNYLNVNTGLLSTTQIYFLTIALQDTDPDAQTPVFENVGVPNLHSLFRDTSVLITLNFKSGDVEVYADVADWNQQAANGWLEKGDTPDFLTN